MRNIVKTRVYILAGQSTRPANNVSKVKRKKKKTVK